MLKINPANVVSIPSDYNNAKGRACEVFSLQEVEGWEEEDVLNGTHGNAWNAGRVEDPNAREDDDEDPDEDDDEYYEDDYEDDEYLDDDSEGG